MSSTPLTYPETLAILHAIKTEPDILANACRTILKKPLVAEDQEDPDKIVECLLLTLSELKADPVAAMVSGAMLAGRLGGQLVKPEAVHDLFNKLTNTLAETFAASFALQTCQLKDVDKAEAEKLLRTLLQSRSGDTE